MEAKGETQWSSIIVPSVQEMVEEKGLSPEIADRIGGFVKEKGAPMELLTKLRQEGSEFLANSSSKEALDELSIMFEALERSKCSHRIVFDLSLARGLDYYTGVIFEAVCIGAEVGSIAAGGRYDNLIGMFGSKQVPAVGMSLGIERVFNIMEEQQKQVTCFPSLMLFFFCYFAPKFKSNELCFFVFGMNGGCSSYGDSGIG